MPESTKIVKGGFRATLALVISIIAVAVSVAAYNRTVDQDRLHAKIERFEAKLEDIKKETSEHAGKIRQDTGQILARMGKSIMKKDDNSQPSPP